MNIFRFFVIQQLEPTQSILSYNSAQPISLNLFLIEKNENIKKMF